ncbi:uncharacterized protein LOC131877206 isoform X2 [Tigriopus californicus]|uniref:uncharacterized protein LOC131877206 isoform X2 n=1 Tax=Tigriopus californicus TaxID=6832 RepID=UPI0027D9FBA6|nr:uncharacterized protein LOC131877206 isoform X2 [Tigriopus californicus]|eukprot:TCALIF_08315-PA protein Name:"Protein of unknown function" AED:0.00 eAED:0.00 QI:291/1/1/1/1/1/2/598/172
MNLTPLHEVRAQVGQAQLTRDRQRLRHQWPLMTGSSASSSAITQTTPRLEPSASLSTDSGTALGGALRALGSAQSDPASPWSQSLAQVLDPDLAVSTGPDSNSWIRCPPQEAQRLDRCYQLGVKLLNPARTPGDGADALDLSPARCAQWATALAGRRGRSLPSLPWPASKPV